MIILNTYRDDECIHKDTTYPKLLKFTSKLSWSEPLDIYLFFIFCILEYRWGLVSACIHRSWDKISFIKNVTPQIYTTERLQYTSTGGKDIPLVHAGQFKASEWLHRFVNKVYTASTESASLCQNEISKELDTEGDAGILTKQILLLFFLFFLRSKLT